MNIWFRTSGHKNRNPLANSYASSFNSSLPVITETHRRDEGLDDECSIESQQRQADFHKNPQEFPSYPQRTNQSTSSKDLFQKTRQNRSSSSQHDEESRSFNQILKTGKSVRFNLSSNEPQPTSGPKIPLTERSTSIIKTKSSYYGGNITQDNEEEEPYQQQIESFPQFKPIKYNKNKRNEIVQRQQYAEEEDNQEMNKTEFESNLRQSNSRSISSRIKLNSTKNQKVSSSSAVSKTGRSINSMEVNFMGTQDREKDGWNLQTKQSARSIEKNSVVKTTGRKQNIKEHIISIIQYCSNEVGMAIYNTTNGEIFLCQIIERLTYFRTISTIQRFYPLEIIYSSSLEHTPLIKKINDKFRNTTMRNFRRMIFDQTKGFQIYNQRGNKEQFYPDNKFIAFSALNALIYYLENSYETKFNYSTLKIRWHLLEDLLIIQSQTIFSLQIFLNAETKQKEGCFINNFNCLTYGGTRMLRANLLQPLSNQQMIKNRQDLVQIFLDDKILYDTICTEIQKFKNFQIITAKFIQMPKQKSIKSLKSYLSAIYSISHMCLLLNNFHKKIQCYKAKNLPIIGKLFGLINDVKITQLKQNIQANFDEQTLKNYESGKSGKKQNFIFLFKIERIDDDFVEVMRITYTHTLQDIIRIFKIIKEKSSCDLKLLYNEFRGYYIKCNKKINLSELSEKIQDDIIQINQRKDSINFSTSILVSLNNRLKQSEKKLILLSQNLLVNIIQDIQKSIDILFDINYEMSIIDMVISFVSFIKKYNMVKFTRPIISKDSGQFSLQGLKTVWTIESKFQVSNQINLNVKNNKKIVIFEKQPNSFQQLNILYSIGYLTILTQIGCFVPAVSFKTDIFHTLLSKIHLIESIESNLSHFQLELYQFKSVMDNVLHKNAKCLILFDELIKGTQYEEQVSLSLALINQLSKISGKTFIIMSDIYQIKVIKKLESEPTKDKNKASNSNPILGQFAEQELRLNFVQIEQTHQAHQIQSIMEDFNFSNEFIDIFRRLSIRKQKTRLFT